jgi:hypothetical protein
MQQLLTGSISANEGDLCGFSYRCKKMRLIKLLASMVVRCIKVMIHADSKDF